MRKIRLDISAKRFHPAWLILGALIGRCVGLIGGLNFGFWYFSDPAALIGWQIFAAVVSALFISFLMTSEATYHTKGAILGLGIGFAAVTYGCEIYLYIKGNEDVRWLTDLNVADGILFEWVYMHAAWISCVIGWIIGAVINKKMDRIRKTPGATDT